MNQTKQEYKEIEEKFSQAVSQHKQYVSEFKNQTMKYSELETLLSKLIHKISHPCMVPLGELACIPGELYHTNEVMVYLGGEYHAKVSTKTAIEIIQGRKKNLKKNIEFEESELNKLYTRMGLTKEIFQPKVENPKEEEEPFEIVEFEKYENVKKPKSILKKNIKVTEKDEDDIEKMLKQLELEEEIWDEEIMEEEITIENNNTTEITDEDEFNKYFKKSKKVQFGDEIIQEEEEEENFERNEELLDASFDKYFNEERKIKYQENNKKMKFDNPFSGQIVERDSMTNKKIEITEKPKKISKFKQSRMENK